MSQDANQGGPTLGEEVREEARQGADRAQGEAQRLADRARREARNMADEARDTARRKADSYKGYAADETGKVASALRRASGDLQDGSPQERAIGAMANGLADFADGMRSKPLGELVEDVQGFARRNPAAFLGGAAMAGFALARFSIASERRSDGIGYGSDTGYGVGRADGQGTSEGRDVTRARGSTASATSGGGGTSAAGSTGGMASPAVDRPADQERGT